MKEGVKRLPLIPLRGMSVFPSMITYFDVGRKKSARAVEEAMNATCEIFLVPQKSDETEDPNIDDIIKIGTICEIKQVVNLPDGTKRVLVEGLNRASIISIENEEELLFGVVEKVEEDNVSDIELEALIRTLKEEFVLFLNLTGAPVKELISSLDEIEKASKVVDIISSYIILEEKDKKEILALLSVKERIEKMLVHIKGEKEIISLEKKIKAKVTKKADKAQKEYYLREQLKAIQEELGEGEEDKKAILEYEKKIANKKLPSEVSTKANYELARLKSNISSGQESGVIRTYLDNLLDIPWGKSKKEIIDIKKAKEILNEDHYGLVDVKERILDYLAVKKVSKSLRSPVICLVGPPGVGKTSIASSIAKSLNRDFVRVSLGGIKDESEIRGHRKTYVGAMPGRIIESIKKSGSMNPVFLLDEIDKMSAEYKGDPYAAMLEVLDTNQNSQFRDHYLELDADLSKVTFVATANTLDTIPRPLLDRMEIIDVSGYTYEEKFNIAKKYLVPKVLKEHGVDSSIIKISDSVVKEIVNYYTRESGVRELDRVLAKLVRKAMRALVEANKKSLSISVNMIEKYLGSRLYSYDIVSDSKVGVVMGLAWTAYGGDTLPVEVNVMDGTGKLELTGKLGDVMKESAKASYSLVRSNCEKFGIENKDFYKNKDIHIHVPEGAVPKDGPSAGVTMTTALVSALSNKPVKGDVAMTGEITLTGRVLPIGGLKEKCLAANRIGIKTIIIPNANKKDLKDIPKNIKSKLNIIIAKEIEDVLKSALVVGE
ncbi:endopeptidase La [uncultured Clostridium sp.]|jgi:ATP-dependent Lon protease|uniref:endopeptidase La n=1 Tax=uncultured Clostridium sp. TaxID=59620 RepID=UPI002608DE0C|nr:endopeptidase La [uncultured Clostridium sp.]